MTLPRFQPRPADPTRIYQASDAACACGSLATRDVTFDCCVECWRAGPWAAAFLEAHGLGSEAQEELRVLRRAVVMYEDALKEVDPAAWKRLLGDVNVCTVVDDELEARRLPRLTDEGGNGGVSLDVGLERPKGKR